ncbi:MAG: transglutaminase-like domain-containing protein [Acidobacteriota bacterium]
MTTALATELKAVLAAHPDDLARAALVFAKLEYPDLDPAGPLARLDALGARAAPHVGAPGEMTVRARIAALNRVIYDEESFDGNRAHYDDFRNSLLNVVLERRLGIPISLALVYMEVARRARLEVFGVAFPGHFLLRVAADAGRDRDPLILDPFNRGFELGEAGCRALLASQLGDDSTFSSALLAPCGPQQMLVRMLNNLKRTYVELRSFPQAYAATDMILAVDPTLLPELRDRGLLAYHLDDFAPALRDLEDYLRLQRWTDDNRDEHEQIWEHVKNLRRRIASWN